MAAGTKISLAPLMSVDPHIRIWRFMSHFEIFFKIRAVKKPDE